MSSVPPPTLNYGTPTPPPLPGPPRRLFRQFLIGMAVGVVISVLAWVAGWNAATKTNAEGLMFYGVIGFKLIAGITLACLRPWRFLGVGLIVSLPVGALIFFMSCAAHL